MGRLLVGALVAALAMFIIGFIFFGPLGLQAIANGNLSDAQAAAVQQSLSANLPHTGTYFVPTPGSSAAQTVMYGQGPIATIHYNTGRFAAMDPTTLGIGFAFNFLIALFIGLGLRGAGGDRAQLARMAIVIAVAGVAFCHLSEPIYYHHDWPHFIYAFVADGLMLGTAGLVLAWFLSKPAVSSRAEAPSETRVD